ncbi:MAG: PqqD family protein [Deltaproteobacteria bacterium]|nr:PqqD family protein [Deltaproteobacteria bacterium]
MPRHFLSRAPAVRTRLDAEGWAPTTQWDFDLSWRPQVPSRAAFAALRPGMRVNHLPGIGALTSPRLTGRTSREPASITRFVAITGIDPLRVYVHGEAGDDDEVIDRLVVATILEGRDAMTRAVRDLLVDPEACFELVRFDIARAPSGELRLLRVVLSPPLDDEPRVIDDTLRLVGLAPLASRVDTTSDLEARWRSIADAELARCGAFRRVVPSPQTQDLLRASPLLRWSDHIIGASGEPREEPRVSLCGAQGFVGKRLVVFAPATQRFYVTNEAAAYVWLGLEEGAPLETIARQLHTQFGIPLARARSDVWDIVARWAHDALVVQEGRPLLSAPKGSGYARAAEGVGEDASLDVGDEDASLDVGDVSHEDRFVPLLRRRLLVASRPKDRAVFAIPGVAVARGRACVVLAGPESIGGAAVAALLQARGASPYASGEVRVDRASGAPLPSAFGLEISELDDLPAHAHLPTYTLPSELLARYVPFDPPSEAVDAVAALVLVRRSSSDAPATLEAIGADTVLEELVGHGAVAHPPLDVAGAEDLLAWLDALPCFVLEVGGDLVSAADRIEALIAEAAR